MDPAVIAAAPLIGGDDGQRTAGETTDGPSVPDGSGRSRRRKRLLVWIIAIIAAFAGATALGLFTGTRPATIGVQNGRLMPVDEGRPNSVSSRAASATHRIEPLPGGADPVAAFARLTTVVESYGGATIVTRRPDYLYAEFRTPLLRFVDDVEFLLDRSAGVIQVRSASRLGHSDLGVNRKRIETIRSRLASAGSG